MRMLRAWLGIATLFVLVSSARADVLKPYVVFMLDTSGSMNATTNAGPPSCGGQDNRLNHAKCAINRIVNSYGDMVFALGRFRMNAGGTYVNACDADGDVNGTDGDQCTSSGIGCSLGDAGGEMLTGLVDGGNQAAATWTDFSCGTCGGAGTALTAQPEVWAAQGSTPLGGTMASASLYWRGIATTGGRTIWPSSSPGFDPIRNDPAKLAFLPTGCDPSPTCTTNCCASQCRSYISIMLTDGDENCSGNAETPLGQMLTTDVDNRRYRIETKVIGFGVPLGDSDIERYAHAGGSPDLPGVYEGYYANDEASLQLALSQILADAVKIESCNNLDDDCDGEIDEDFKPPMMVPGLGGSCTNGQLGQCARTGSYVCTADGSGLQCTAPAVTPGNEGTTCNGLDDDCDGKIDEQLGCTPCPAVAETCNGLDDDCDGVADQTCRCSNDSTIKCDQVGNDCGAGTCVCTPIVRDCVNTVPGVGSCPGTQQCIGANTWTQCAGAQVPTTESCNGLDDDCDGVCDGMQTGCSEVNGTCNPNVAGSCPQTDSPGDPGHWPGPDAAETNCTDDVDNDLDGLINDGCAAVGAPETACNDAVDNDGDGTVNDGCPVPSLPIAQNICHPGTKTCAALCDATNGNSWGICSGEVKPLATDPCNGLDDDCDNKIDEMFVPQDCSTNCGVGQTACVNGTITCNSTPATDDTTCNNVDDDCDNKIDEDWICDNPINGMCPCGVGAVCGGLEKCVNGTVVCQGTPTADETCNCNDDDCDTKTDEDSLCPAGSTCTNCQCAFPCTPGEFPCPLGKYCSNSFCVNDPCYMHPCPPVNGHVQTCIPDPTDTNAPLCVDACTQQSCNPNEVCVDSTGECAPNDCRTFPCASGNVCIVNPDTQAGECMANTCEGVQCAANQYCLGGNCVASCADVTCPSGQRCRQGACEPDPCGKPCPYGQSCNDTTGKCIENPCTGRSCADGQWCNPNSRLCEIDPCVLNDITCPGEDEVCLGGTCVDRDSTQPDAANEAHVTVGGGGGCSTTGGGSGLLLGLALLLARRRRQPTRTTREGGAR